MDKDVMRQGLRVRTGALCDSIKAMMGFCIELIHINARRQGISGVVFGRANMSDGADEAWYVLHDHGKEFAVYYASELSRPIEDHRHPTNHDATVRGILLQAGDVIQEGDVHAEESGEWKEVACVGGVTITLIEKCGRNYVRPAPRQEPPFDADAITC